jgi:hypothetical protein
MPHFDLCLAWNWEYDAGFARLLETACTQHQLTLYQVTPGNLEVAAAGLQSGNFSFSTLLDRASDSEIRFQVLVEWARRNGSSFINPQEQTQMARDKAKMQLEFNRSGIDTPYTFLLPPFTEQPDLPSLDLGLLGGSFAIKPAGTGGGVGVVLEACTLDQVAESRQQYPGEKYLLQAHVSPLMLEGRPAWFRVLVCDGAVYPSWWDTRTHIYTRVTAEEKARFSLRPLYEIARSIARICRLDLFSTEIALTDAGQFLVVDYVNDPVDLRLQSEAEDGVPLVFVENIAGRLARLAGKRSIS